MATRSLVTNKIEREVTATIIEKDREPLELGEVEISVEYSGINYKDALAVTGKGKIQRTFPLVPGIDLAGTVQSSNSEKFQPGDQVLVNGCGLGETFNGGFQQVCVVSEQHIMRLPAGLTAKQAMIHGTAGFTAALAIHRMQQNGQTPEMGPIVVTGATGGVGSIALSILKTLGYETIAVTSRKEQFTEFLTKVGADAICTQAELELGTRPLESVKFGGVIDNIGGALLAKLVAHTQLWGNIACIGLADSPEYQSTVFPLILRGVSLLGVSSTNCHMDLRNELWHRLGGDWRVSHLEEILQDTISLEEVIDYSHKLIDRQLLGRVVVKL